MAGCCGCVTIAPLLFGVCFLPSTVLFYPVSTCRQCIISVSSKALLLAVWTGEGDTVLILAVQTASLFSVSACRQRVFSKLLIYSLPLVFTSGICRTALILVVLVVTLLFLPSTCHQHAISELLPLVFGTVETMLMWIGLVVLFPSHWLHAWLYQFFRVTGHVTFALWTSQLCVNPSLHQNWRMFLACLLTSQQISLEP